MPPKKLLLGVKATHPDPTKGTGLPYKQEPKECRFGLVSRQGKAEERRKKN